MIKGLTAGFGDPIGAELLEQLKARGIQCIRQGIGHVTRTRYEQLAEELKTAGLRALWIISCEQIAWLQPGDWAEFGNEPDLYSPMAQDIYMAQIEMAFSDANRVGVRLSAGAISNLNTRGFAFLERMLPFIPEDAPVAIHRYPTWPGQLAAHNPSSSRVDEIARLRDIIDNRALWVTEVGYHSAVWPNSWWQLMFKTVRWWTDQQIADFARWEFVFWQRFGAELCVWYQLNDGPTDVFEHRFGIRRVDGSWKPVAEAFK